MGVQHCVQVSCLPGLIPTWIDATFRTGLIPTWIDSYLDWFLPGLMSPDSLAGPRRSSSLTNIPSVMFPVMLNPNPTASWLWRDTSSRSDSNWKFKKKHQWSNIRVFHREPHALNNSQPPPIMSDPSPLSTTHNPLLYHEWPSQQLTTPSPIMSDPSPLSTTYNPLPYHEWPLSPLNNSQPSPLSCMPLRRLSCVLLIVTFFY